MIRFIFLLVLVFHGLLHLLGFLKQWQLAELSQLSGRALIPLSSGASRVLGVLWLITCLVFLVAAAAYLMRKEWWWFIAALAVFISQVLIILYWPDARFGTIANLIIIIGVVLGYASVSFHRMAEREVGALLAGAESKKEVVTEAMVSDLPAPVQRWLKKAGVVGKEKKSTVHLKQQGRMRTRPEASWMPVTAEQYFSTKPPAFVWVADVKALPFVHLSGRDKYAAGHGHMLIKLLSLLPVADATGPETDQGTLLRYLAEMIWFPSAALEPYIRWEAVDDLSARATMSYGETTASGLFTFDEQGDFRAFEAQRYYERDGQFNLETWSVASDNHKNLGGYRIPVRSVVTWKLPEGDFTWFEVEITEVDYQ